MTTETLTALQDSIRHWHRLATGTQGKDETPGASCCALCANYWLNGRFFEGKACRGCPVSERTGDNGCIGTPWQAAYDLWEDFGTGGEEFRRAGAKELAFLLDLLPAEARPAMDAELAALSGTCHVCGIWAMHPETFVQKDGLVCAACA